jgi:ATP-dependent Clp protease ATP-binding subunit ClpC
MARGYTDRAERAVDLAKQETRNAGYRSVTSGHVLFGLIGAEGMASRVLKGFDLSQESVRDEIEKLTKVEKVAILPHNLPWTPEAQRISRHAFIEADNFDSPYIETEHLLLALLEELGEYEVESNALVILKKLGMNPKDIRKEVLRLLG